MKILRTAFGIFLGFSLVAYMLAAWPVAGWLEWCTLAGILIIGFLTNKQHNFLVACLLLCTYLVLALAALLRQCNALILISGFCFALAAWDIYLELWRHKIQSNVPSVNAYVNAHVKLLGGITISSSVIALLLLNLRLHIPFLGIYILAAAVLVGLFGMLTSIKKMPTK